MNAYIQNGWLTVKDDEPYAAPIFMVRLDTITAIKKEDTEHNNPVLKIRTAQHEYELVTFGEGRWDRSEETFMKIQKGLLNITEKQNKDEQGEE